MLRIGFVGTPGSGKTSTSRSLASSCRGDERLKRVELVPEYARRYIKKYGIESLYDQVRILEKQIGWEDDVPTEHTDLLITDSPIFMSFAYVLDIRYQDEANRKNIMISNDIFKKLNKLNTPRRYDAIFHLPPVLPVVEDGIRPPSNFDPKWREEMDTKIKSVFQFFPPKKLVTIESLSLEERVDECLDVIKDIL